MKTLSVVTLLFLSVATPNFLLAQNDTRDAVEKFRTLLNVLDRIYVDSVDTDELVKLLSLRC